MLSDDFFSIGIIFSARYTVIISIIYHHLPFVSLLYKKSIKKFQIIYNQHIYVKICIFLSIKRNLYVFFLYKRSIYVYRKIHKFKLYNKKNYK